MKLYELIIDQEETDEVFAISMVSQPAIELPFYAFDKEEIQFAKIESEQQMLIGPILVPDKKILRVDGEGKPYSVFFKKDTIKRLAQNYLKKKYTDKTTLEHDSKVKGVYLVESWIKEGKMDKSNLYGLNLPIGSWIGMFKVDNQQIWDNYVKTGAVTGLSIEGLFEHKLVEASKISDILFKNIDDLTETEAEVALSFIRARIQKDNRYKSKKRIDFESYQDYPDGVKSNAQKVLDWVEKNGWGSCGTAVGKQRANQLAKGEPISVDTIRRMFSYLTRHEVDLESSKSYSDGCGKLMYDSWGGKAALGWSRNKLRELGLLEEGEAQPTISDSSYGGEASGSVSPALLS